MEAGELGGQGQGGAVCLAGQFPGEGGAVLRGPEARALDVSGSLFAGLVGEGQPGAAGVAVKGDFPPGPAEGGSDPWFIHGGGAALGGGFRNLGGGSGLGIGGGFRLGGQVEDAQLLLRDRLGNPAIPEGHGLAGQGVFVAVHGVHYGVPVGVAGVDGGGLVAFHGQEDAVFPQLVGAGVGVAVDDQGVRGLKTIRL